jgi:hypothetical protein
MIILNSPCDGGGGSGCDVVASPAGGISSETGSPSPISSTRNNPGIGPGSGAVAYLTVNMAASSLCALQV